VSKPYKHESKRQPVYKQQRLNKAVITFTQVHSASKVGFLPKSKTGHNNHPQALKPDYLSVINFLDFFTTENTVLGLIGTQEMHISSFRKMACSKLTKRK